MAIVFLEEKNRKKYLYLGGGLVIVALFIFIIVYFSNQEVLPTLQPIQPRKIVINWGALDNPILQQLDPPPQIPEPPQIESRGNPFEEFVFPTTTPTTTSPTLTSPQ